MGRVGMGETITGSIIGTQLYERRPILIGFIIFIAAFVLLFPNIANRDIWGDEDYMTSLSQGGFWDLGIPENSSNMQQPPFPLILQGLGISNIALSETGIRIHSVLLGALSVFLFFLLIKKFVQNRYIVYMMVFLFMFNSHFYLYSRVGKPAANTIFYALLYLLLLFRIMENDSDKTQRYWPYILLIIVQTWFLLSEGFQPTVFLLVAGITLLPFLFYKKYRTKIIVVYLTGLVSLAMIIPFLYMNITNSKAHNYIAKPDTSGVVKKILQLLFSFDSTTYSFYINGLLNRYVLFFIITLLLGVVGRIYHYRKQSKISNNKTFPYFLYFFIFAVIYPQVFHATFESTIIYPVQTRYFISTMPVIMSLMALSAFYGYRLLLDLVKIKPGLRLKYLPHAIFVILLIGSFVWNFPNLVSAYSAKHHEYRKLYDLFKYESRPGDIAYIYNLVPPGKWAPDAFYSCKYYYTDKNLQYVVLKNSIPIMKDYPAILSGQQRGDIYIVFITGQEKLKSKFFRDMEYIRPYSFNKIFVARIYDNGVLAKNILNFFRRIKDEIRETVNNLELYETVFEMEMMNQNYKEARQIVYKLRDLDYTGKYKNRISQLRERWHITIAQVNKQKNSLKEINP